MKRFAVIVVCFCICFVGLLRATPLTDEEYKYVYQYSLTPPDDDYFPIILEEFVRLEDPLKEALLLAEQNGTDATETGPSVTSPSTILTNVSPTSTAASTTPTNFSTTPTNVSTTPSNVSTTYTNVSTMLTSVSTTPTNVSTMLTSVTAAPADVLTTANVSITSIDVSTTPTNVSTTSTNVLTTTTSVSTTIANVSTAPNNVSTTTANDMSCVNETSDSKTAGIEVSIPQVSTTISPAVGTTTKKMKITVKGDGLDSSMYIVRKGDLPEIIGLNIGLYYVLRDTKKKMETDEEISVKPLIRILALTEKIKKLGGRIHPRNQDLMKKIYGEILKTLSNSS